MALNARVGLLGGSFDPPHRAHVALAGLFYQALDLTELLILPAGQPWQKDHLHTTPAQRLKMTQLAFAGAPFPLSIDDREMARAGPSYTIDTLRELRGQLGPAVSLTFLMGADQFLALPSWHGWPEMLELANFAAAGRPGTTLARRAWPKGLAEQMPRRQVAANALSATAGQIVLVDADLGDLSSSQVRELLRQRTYQPLADLVPSAVLDYIRKGGLYLS